MEAKLLFAPPIVESLICLKKSKGQAGNRFSGSVVSGQSKRAERGIYAASRPGCAKAPVFLGIEAYRTLKRHKCRAPPASTEPLLSVVMGQKL